MSRARVRAYRAYLCANRVAVAPLSARSQRGQPVASRKTFSGPQNFPELPRIAPQAMASSRIGRRFAQNIHRSLLFARSTFPCHRIRFPGIWGRIRARRIGGLTWHFLFSFFFVGEIVPFDFGHFGSGKWIILLLLGTCAGTFSFSPALFFL